LAAELAKAQVSALCDMPPPSNFGLRQPAGAGGADAELDPKDAGLLEHLGFAVPDVLLTGRTLG
jgi:hypothetical protein